MEDVHSYAMHSVFVGILDSGCDDVDDVSVDISGGGSVLGNVNLST